MAFYGSYTNQTTLNNLPENTVLIGRVCSGARLFHLLDISSTTGLGKKQYTGFQLLLPKKFVRMTIPWQTARAYSSGKTYEFKIKMKKYLRWRVSGKLYTLHLMIIAPPTISLDYEIPPVISCLGLPDMYRH